MNDNTETALGSYREDGKTLLYTFDGVPSDWIDEAGMPSGAFEDLAKFIANEVDRGRQHQNIQIGFAYLHKGQPYAAVARTSPHEGVTIRVNYIGGVAEVSPSRMTVVEFADYSDLVAMMGTPSKFEYERLRENLTKPPVWRMTKATSQVTRKYDPVTGLVLTESSHPAHGISTNMTAYRPTTKIAAIQKLLRLLRRSPYAWERRAERSIRDIRLLGLGTLGSKSDFSRDLVTEMTIQDVGVYDGLIDSIADIGDNWERYYRTLARVAQFAHAALPEVCRLHVLHSLWRQTLSNPFYERFGADIANLRPSFDVEFTRNYGLAIQNFAQALPPGEEYTEEGYTIEKARLIELLVGNQ